MVRYCVALKKRTASAGISDDAIDSAMESSSPKVALIELLLEHYARTANAEETALRAVRRTDAVGTAKKNGECRHR